MSEYRIEKDSLGEVRVPAKALYGAQTQRAVENFPISGQSFPRSFLKALGLVKAACARANHELGLMPADMATAIEQSARDVAEGKYDDQFPVDIFQTGSGTSTNMNANEVIATLASRSLGKKVHPNDHVNMSQSSNDVIPTAISVAAYLEAKDHLVPSLQHLHDVIVKKAATVHDVVKTGRTHLMDAMPLRMSQEMSGWAAQVRKGRERVESVFPRLGQLALGGTAVGTGINAHPEFGGRVAAVLAKWTGASFRPSDNFFESLSAADAAVELSGQLKTVAASLMKIANDLRWMNSGPIAGTAEIVLPALQPGSSIMPGKINPVIPEAMMMVCAQVIGNDVTVTVGGQSASFQLNVMLPVIAANVLESETLLANAARVLADLAIEGFKVNREHIASLVDKNPILVTALNPVIGYELGAKVAKTAYAQGRSLKDVAVEMTKLSRAELDALLDPAKMTEGGIQKGGGSGGGG
ncbi:MAG: class II fumarate hydratase [Planctomycetes bacterium]|nr:class II fumarate hydratase [Planctomycetota bacterium]